MFLETSRYYKQPVVEITTKNGFTIRAITIRRLPPTDGTKTIVKGNERLDTIAQRKYDNATMFWRIADANTELEANDLLKKKFDDITSIKVPEQ